MARTPTRTRTRASKRTRPVELAMLKQPRQSRAGETVEAIVTAATRLLSTRGYTALTTNHIADTAGVGIGSLYEYFPGKDAIVAQVTERLVDRVVVRLAAAVPEVLATDPRRAIGRWIELIHHTLVRERKLVAVLVHEVPYLRSLPAIRAITPRLLTLSKAIRTRTGLTIPDETATLYLLINLVSTTILQVVLDPPPDVTPERLLRALATRVEAWLSQPTPRRLQPRAV